MRKNKLFLAVVGLLLAVVAQAYETVDLGLPSRTLWATTNVGASSETDLGSYYAWAETSVKTEYSQPNYVYQTGITQEGDWGASKLTKYCAADGKTVLDGSDDAATQAWGSTWVTPTTEQLNELINECTWTLEGNGYRVTGKNGKSIYLPLAGYRYDGPGGTGTHDATTRGCYLANSCTSSYGTCNYLDIRTDGDNRVSNVNRFYGMSLRPVSTEKAAPTPLVLSDLTISKNEGRTLAPTFTGTATWTSSAPTVAHVDNEGHVSGINGGTATITATLEDGTTASCTVTVYSSYFYGYNSASGAVYKIDGLCYRRSGTDLLVTYGGTSAGSSYIGDIVIPDAVSFNGSKFNVTGIHAEAFHSCSRVTSVIFTGNNITTIGSVAFYGCSGLTSIEIPSSVTSIGGQAFMNCSSLTTFVIPSTVTSIGNKAFSGCTSLVCITSLPETVPTLGTDNLTDLQIIYVPAIALDEYRNAVNWSNYKSHILAIGFQSEYDITVEELPETSIVYKTIGEENLSSIVKLKVSGTINSYDIMIMRNQMPNLRYLDISNATIKANSYEYYTGYHTEDNQIGPYAFNLGIIEVKLPLNLEGRLCMSGLPYLKSIFIPRGITVLGDNAFKSCISLESITFDKDSELKKIGSYAFYDASLKSLDIPGKCESIGENMLNYDDKKMKSIRFLEGSDEPIKFTDIYRYYGAGGGYHTLEYLYIGRNTEKGVGGWGATISSVTKLEISKKVRYINGQLLRSDANIGSIAVEDMDAWIIGKQCSFFSGIPKGHLYFGENEVIDVNIPENAKEVPEQAFKGFPIKTVLMHPNVESIGAYAFQNCTELEEVHIPSMMKSIGNYAFNGCSKLNDIYTYTIEPQKIDQNTFSTYTTATLHCPAQSSSYYLFDTQWSQFLKRVAFDEDYDKFFLGRSDFKLDENTGSISGTPDVEIGAGAGLIVEGIEQDLNEVHVGFDGTTNKGASLIGRVHANKIYLDLSVKADYWYYFCFPFNVDLATIQKSGGYIFRYYDGDQRANGGSGWRDIAAGTTHLNAGQGYIFRTNEAGTLTIVVDKKTVEANDLTVDKLTQLTAHEATSGETAADNKGWNFIGNPYISYYDINELGYTAPMVTWNGTSYEALRPGDDDYTLYPFQAFFVQKPENVDKVGFETSGTTTYIQSQEGGSSKAKAAKAKASKAQAMDRNRQLINLTLTDGTATDKTRVVFNDKQLLTYETDCDASKFSLTAGVPQLYSVDAEGIKYSINERPVDNGTVKLGYQAPEDGIYTISATRMDANVVLYDAVRGTTHDLAKGCYTFNSEAGKFENRFSLIMVGETTGIDSVDADAAGGVDSTYDLSGRHAKNVKKGVVIKNNKKVVIK